MPKLDVSTVLTALNPTQPPEALLASIVVYVMALLTLVALLMQKEGSTRDTVLLLAVIMACLIDKIAATSILRAQITGLTHNTCATDISRLPTCVCPTSDAGSTKTEK